MYQFITLSGATLHHELIVAQKNCTFATLAEKGADYLISPHGVITA
jgi:hypothetical protein